MNNEHVDAYFNALSENNIEQVAEHLAEDIVLLSPVFPEPFIGKASVVPVLAGLRDTIDSIDLDLKIPSGQDVAIFFTIKCQDVTVNGNEHMHVNEDGLIDRIMVAWRPLPSVVLIQQKLAAKLGGQPLQLVPVEKAD